MKSRLSKQICNRRLLIFLRFLFDQLINTDGTILTCRRAHHSKDEEKKEEQMGGVIRHTKGNREYQS